MHRMSDHPYDKATATAIFAMAVWADSCTIRDDGVFLNEEFRAESPVDTVFDWTPAYDMVWTGSPNPMTAPALPIPFTASELAACMLDGPGSGIQRALDRRVGYALDDEALSGFELRRRDVCDALRGAYSLAAEAQTQVGEFDYNEEREIQVLLGQVDDAIDEANTHEGVFEAGISNDEQNQRRARATASVADLKARAQQSKATVQAKWFAWRKAMVSQLLQPGPANTQSQAGTVEAAPLVIPDPERRLIALRVLGGTARWKRSRGELRWVFTGIKGLLEQEKRKGFKRSDEKTIRRDLVEAAEAESVAKRSGEVWNR